MSESILLTGPVHAFDRWRAPLESAGWRVELLPLIETIARAFERPKAKPNHVVFTSTAAVRFFGSANELGSVSCSTVGEATGEAARAAGYRVELISRGTAKHLAADMIERFEASDVLWPRGDLARDLGEQLREAGWAVEAPIVYRTVESNVQSPPNTGAVFFASPSAVRAWCARWPADRLAVAIGLSTKRALVEAAWTAARTMATPDPAGLLDALRD